MTTTARPESVHAQRLAQLETAAADPAHPTHEASVWTLRRYRELLLQRLDWCEDKALQTAIDEYRALNQEDPEC